MAKARATSTPASASAAVWTRCNAPSSSPNSTASMKRSPNAKPSLAAGIPTAVHYPIPLNEQPAYAHLAGTDGTPIAARIARQILCLPMHADLSEAEQLRIVAPLLDAIE